MDAGFLECGLEADISHMQNKCVYDVWTTAERTKKKKDVLDKLGLTVKYESKRS